MCETDKIPAVKGLLDILLVLKGGSRSFNELKTLSLAPTLSWQDLEKHKETV